MDLSGNPTSVDMSAEVSAIVDVVYEGFIPQILTISAGFYAVPYMENIPEYIDKVDTYPDSNPYVDRIIWKINDASDAAFPYNVAWYNGNYQ